MGLINTKLTLRNAMDERLEPCEVEALVDTGALLLCIPKHVATQLQLPELHFRAVTTADGANHTCPYVGPVEISFKNRTCYTGAIVLGDDVVPGAVPMEDLDVVINPSAGTIEVNPESPNMQMAPVKLATGRLAGLDRS